jgi:hypothetical protein
MIINVVMHESHLKPGEGSEFSEVSDASDARKPRSPESQNPRISRLEGQDRKHQSKGSHIVD